MADEKKTTEEKATEELSDMEIAELANQELKKKQAEIEKLTKELAKQKLLSQAPEDESVKNRSTEECNKVLDTNGVSNYDCMQAVCEIVENELENGQPNPLGANGEEVYNFLKEVLKTCDGDKSKFPSVYQAMIAPDDPKIAMAYSNRNKRK